MSSKKYVHILLGATALLVAGAGLRGALTPSVKGKWAAAGGMTVARSGACAVALKDGRVLVTGGTNESGVLESAEFVSFNGASSAVASMSFARTGHVCAALEDGTVLVAGGRTRGGAATASAEIFDPATGAWQTVDWLASTRDGATASVLKDGRVLIAGGEADGVLLPTLEIYDPETKSFSLAPGMLAAPRKEHAAAVLKDGRVALAGGFDGKAPIDTLEIYDPATGAVALAGKMSSPRAGLSATTLLDGRVFLAGGSNGETELASTETWDPATGHFASAAALDLPRRGHLAFRIPDNNSVLITGGTWSGEPLPTSGLYIPWRDSFEQMEKMTAGVNAAAGAATSGKVLLTGGASRSATSQQVLFATVPTIQTDKADYSPGEWVSISGANWTSGSKVDLVVKVLPERTIVRWQKVGAEAAVANADGTISVTNALQMNSEDAGKTFELTAIEQGTGLTAAAWVFSDASLRIRSAPSGVTFSFSWQRYSDSACTIQAGGSGTTTITNSYSDINVGNGWIKLMASPSAITPSGATFQYWTNDNNPAIQLPNNICVEKPTGPTIVAYTATYSLPNTAPTVTPPSSQAANEGGSSSFLLGSFSDPDGGPWNVQVNWGDLMGTGFTMVSPGTIPAMPHAYADNGTYTVTVTVTDSTSRSGSATFQVTVANVAPTATFTASSPVNEGSSISLALVSPVDPSSVDTTTGFTYAFDCGAGYGAYSGTNTASCPTNDNGTRSVKGKIRDKDGGETEYTATVTINNVAPTATFNAPASVNEGSPIGLSLTSPFDPSSVDSTAGFTYAFDCGDGSGYGAFGASNSTSCPTTDNGNRTVKGKIMDKDGGVTEYTAAVAIINVAPSPAITGAPASSPEGTPISLGSSVTDPGSADTFTYAWSVMKNGNPYGSGGTGSTYSFTPDDNGTYVVTLTVTDDDGGSGTDTKTINVTNVNPSLSNVAVAPSSVNEGGSVTLTGNIADPGTADTFSLKIDWKDGTIETVPLGAGTSSFSKTHTYADDNPSGTSSDVVIILVDLTDDDTGAAPQASASLTVNNVAPTATINGAPVSSPEGTAINLTTTVTDPGVNDTFTYAWSVTKNGSAYGSGSASTFSFTPNDNGTYVVSLTVTDDDTGTITVSRTIDVTNVAPTAAITGAPASSPEGTLISLASSVTDPGSADTFTYAWNVTKNGSPYGSGSSSSFAFTPDDNGSYVVTLTVTDDDGGVGTDSKTIAVTNVAPSVSVPSLSNATINEGETITLSGGFVDPGTADTHTLQVDWGDGSPLESFNIGAGLRSFSVTHLYKDDIPTATATDVNTISVKVIDDDGGFGVNGTTITVNNVAPTITVSGPLNPLPAPANATINVSITDPGILDTFTCVFSWDDATGNTTVPTGAGATSCSANHSYTAAGVYRVGVTVTDDDTGTASGFFEYVVVYDPNAGFVTGGGWIMSPAGAYIANPALTGKANFGFVSKYKKGQTAPEGNTEFQFHAGSFNFSSINYQWLVVSGPKSQYKGTGTVNGAGNYGFLLTATDGQINGGGGVDKFRIKIWDTTNNVVVYDNVLGGSDDIDSANPQAIGGGSIVIHTGGK